MFGHRVLYQHRIPGWLRPIDYRVPAPLARLGFKVALFAVDFSAPAAVAHERIGLYQLGRGETALAEKSFLASLAKDASRPNPWLLEGKLMMESGRLMESVSFFHAGIQRVPERDREQLVRAVTALLNGQGAEGQNAARALLDRMGQRSE
jgi:Tfp pilus assembly protein PilF